MVTGLLVVFFVSLFVWRSERNATVRMASAVQSPGLDCNWDSNLFPFLLPLNNSAWEPD